MALPHFVQRGCTEWPFVGVRALCPGFYELPRWSRSSGLLRNRYEAFARFGQCNVFEPATHLTMSMLSTAHPTVIFGRTQIHLLPYGRQKQEPQRERHEGAVRPGRARPDLTCHSS